MNINSIANPSFTAATAMQGSSPSGQATAAHAAQDVHAGQTTPPATPEQIAKALDEVRAAVQPMAQSLQFSMDKDSGRTIVKVMDTETNEVIRQIPSEEVLAMSKAIGKLQGLLVKQTA